MSGRKGSVSYDLGADGIPPSLPGHRYRTLNACGVAWTKGICHIWFRSRLIPPSLPEKGIIQAYPFGFFPRHRALSERKGYVSYGLGADGIPPSLPLGIGHSMPGGYAWTKGICHIWFRSRLIPPSLPEKRYGPGIP